MTHPVTRARHVPQWIYARHSPAKVDNMWPFRNWDGEGITPEGETVQNYVVFGWHQERQNGYEHRKIVARNLGTMQCLEFMLENARDKVYNVGYGLTYDVDQILKDLPDGALTELHVNNQVQWGDYKITYLPGKIFSVRRKGAGQFTLYDTVSFFRQSFLTACGEYLPEYRRDIDGIKDGKDARPSFTYADLYTLIIPYWEREGTLGCRLMDALRASLNSAGIALTKWYGPGAIADRLITKHRLSKHIIESWDDTPDAVKMATRYAYFGGRFDNRMIGRIPGPIYSYDIRSAYPAALSVMPGLVDGQWVHTIAPETLHPWGLYKYQGTACRPQDYGLFPHRSASGTTTFAHSGAGWLYGNELIAAAAFADIELLESWEWVPDFEPTPIFQWLKEMYLLRAHYKAIGNPAQYGLKLGYNSLYGKLAQLVGFDPETLRPPKTHHQWYAGQTTAFCRARVLRAAMMAPDDIVSIETDGIYSLAPLDLKQSDRLGDWETKQYDEMVYIQSGWYFARKGDEWLEVKRRGIGTMVRGTEITPEYALKYVDRLEPLKTTVTRYGAFTGHLGRNTLHSWHHIPHQLVWGGTGKRLHTPSDCPGCVGRTQYHTAELENPYPSTPTQPRQLPWETEPAHAI